MSFSASLRDRAAPIWEREFAHPFVRGLGDGSLDPERFKVWLRQDWLFLVEYARVLALAAARAGDLGTMTRFAALLQSTLAVEMDLHRRYARRFGITAEDLERARPSAACGAYTGFLLRVAWEGPLAAIVAALLPCAWGYGEVARRLAAGGGDRPENPYGEWIRTYTSEEFTAYAEWMRDMLDRLAEPLGPAERDRLAAIFEESSEHEYRFWEMAWRRDEPA
ncbi:MAG: thiaminase II [Candidatus Polarisedimenticolia bacterium]